MKTPIASGARVFAAALLACAGVLGAGALSAKGAKRVKDAGIQPE